MAIRKAVHEQQDILCNGSGVGGIYTRECKGAHKGSKTKGDKGYPAKCIQCGRENRARGAKCYKYQKFGHYGAICQSRDFFTVTQESEQSCLEHKQGEPVENQFLGAIKSHTQTH